MKRYIQVNLKIIFVYDTNIEEVSSFTEYKQLIQFYC